MRVLRETGEKSKHAGGSDELGPGPSTGIGE